jgi:hypothetical protein
MNGFPQRADLFDASTILPNINYIDITLSSVQENTKTGREKTIAIFPETLKQNK